MIQQKNKIYGFALSSLVCLSFFAACKKTKDPEPVKELSSFQKLTQHDWVYSESFDDYEPKGYNDDEHFYADSCDMTGVIRFNSNYILNRYNTNVNCNEDSTNQVFSFDSGINQLNFDGEEYKVSFQSEDAMIWTSVDSLKGRDKDNNEIDIIYTYKGYFIKK